MKKTFYIIVLGTLSLCTLLASCQKQDNLFNVDGDCHIDSLVLDDIYPGIVNHAARTVIVEVPVVHDDHVMTITTLNLSAGAKATPAKGAQVNMTSPIAIHVENGNVYQDYKVSVKHHEAKILSFKINDKYIGRIDQVAHTITVPVPVGTNLKTLIPTIKTTEGATLTPAAGVSYDFTNPMDFNVTYKTASTTYTVTVKEKENPVILYLGLADNMEDLNPEEQEAVNWLLANVENSDYASFDDLAANRVVLTDCKVIWWHFHSDDVVQGKVAFETAAPEAVNYVVLDQLKEYYQAGGSFLFTRFAVNMPYYLGEKRSFPDNCFGNPEAEAKLVDSPWDFRITDHTDHPLWQNLIMGAEPDRIYTCDKGYRISNTSAQYKMSYTFADKAEFCEKTGAYDIAGPEDAIVAWEYKRTAEHGAIVCIGSGCYDWYTVAEPSEYTSYYHANEAKITENAFNYLKQ